MTLQYQGNIKGISRGYQGDFNEGVAASSIFDDFEEEIAGMHRELFLRLKTSSPPNITAGSLHATLGPEDEALMCGHAGKKLAEKFMSKYGVNLVVTTEDAKS
tara:strand:+ start:3809 stop:4117 length:309 start_codon:yes stop_codon:yes gene_type:complete